MKNNELMLKMSRSFHKAGFKLKQHSPEILVAVGVVGIIGSVIMACKATLKVNEVVEEAKDSIDMIHDAVENEKKTADGTVYTQEVANQDLAIVYAQTGWKFVKLYGPAVALGAVSIGCMVGSSVILRKRNAALAASLTAANTAFKDYRDRLIERFGKDLDRELRYNIKAKQIEERIVDEDGNETIETHTVEVMDPNSLHSVYSVIFDEYNPSWCKNAELNKFFLVEQQQAANFRLQRQGVLTLNEVYEMLGFPRTKFGQFAGWVYTEDNTAGDNHVDFGMFDIHSEGARDFINLRERSIILDFNCIGNVIDYM